MRKKTYDEPFEFLAMSSFNPFIMVHVTFPALHDALHCIALLNDGDDDEDDDDYAY